MKLANLKVLIVDDDAFFRDVLKQCIESEGSQALAVESIEFAKKAIPFFQPDLIVSDVQMPGGTGIDFLAWAKATQMEIPIIIMTGFSELVDAASAAAAGAAGFLAKPFKKEDLHDLLFELKHEKKQPGLETESDTRASAQCQDLDYMKISVEDLIVGSQIQTAIYLKLPSSTGYRFVKVAHNGEDLSLDRIRAYKAKGVNHLYLQREDYLKYIGMTVKITQAAAATTISDEKRARLIRNTMEVVEQQIFSQGLTEEVFDHAKTLVEVSVSIMSGTDAGFFALESIREISDELYAHAAAVSMIASMIGKQIGWTSPKTLQKVAMAGMLHDIGKRQLSRELALKSKTQMNAEELALYEAHPARGAAILSELDFVPADVVQAVSHHHERGNGLGFPAHLTEHKIFPLAKVIAVADEFVSIYLKNTEDREKRDPKKAVQKLMEFHSEGLSAEPLIALHRGFDMNPPEELLKKTKKEFTRAS